MTQRILYINPTAIHGGAEEALLRAMIVAQDAGYAPVLVVPRPGWLTAECRSRDIPCELLPSLPDAFVSERWQQQFRPWLINAIAIAQLARKWGALLVHSNTPRSSYHGGLGARIARIAAITHVHDIVSLPYRTRTRARLLDRLSDLTLVPSQAVADAVSRLAPQLRPKLQVLYYGWDAALYDDVEAADLSAEYGISAGVPVIATVAAMTPWKGQDVLIDALPGLLGRHPGTKLLIVGGVQGGARQLQYEQELRRKVGQLGLRDNIIFTGWRDDVWPLIKRCDVFAHVPTQPDPLPTALLHACGLGRPIVASRTGGIPEIIENGSSGILVAPSDAAALTRALDTLLGDAALRETLARQAEQRFRARFSREQMRDGLSAAYRVVWKRGPARRDDSNVWGVS